MSGMTIPADRYEGTADLPPFAMVPTFLTAFALPLERLPEGVTSWECVNGDTTYTVTALPSVGPDGIKRTEVPSGRYARLALIWLFAKAGAIGAIRQAGREGAPTTVELGRSAHEFLELLGVPKSGRAYKEAALQLHLVTSATWQITTSEKAKRELTEGALERRGQMTIAEEVTLWHPTAPDGEDAGRADVIPSLPSVTFSTKALTMAKQHVMVPWSAIHQLMHLAPKSPLPLDIYLWLAARRESLDRTPRRITWAQLMAQFSPQVKVRPAEFKARFWAALDGPVRAVWPEAIEGMYLPDVPDSYGKAGRPEEDSQRSEAERWSRFRGVVLVGGKKGPDGLFIVPNDPCRMAISTRVRVQMEREVRERVEARAEKRRAARRKTAPELVADAPVEANAATTFTEAATGAGAPAAEGQAPAESVPSGIGREDTPAPLGSTEAQGERQSCPPVSRSVSGPLGHDEGEG